MNPVIIGILAAMQTVDLPRAIRCENPRDYAMEIVAPLHGGGGLIVYQQGEDRQEVGIIKTFSLTTLPNGVQFIGMQRITNTDGTADTIDVWEECKP
jgi:hypothetical protein